MAFTALAAGVSGLQAFSEGVGVIADNITNVNTIGYKEARSRFSTLVTETSDQASYSPGGVRASTDSLISKQGLLQPSTSATDLAIDGAGFFVVKKSESAEATGGLQYTRAGAFSKNSEGYYKNTAGHFLMGWPVDSSGVFAGNQQDPNALEPIKISDRNGVAEASTTASIRANLQASTALNTTYTGAGDFADGTETPDFETNLQIFDSLGQQHTVVIAASKTGASTWSYEMYFDDETVLNTTNHPDGLIASGELAFYDDGTIDLTNTNMLASDGVTTIDLSAGDAVPITYDNTETLVADGSIVFDFGTDGDTDGWTQTDSLSSLISSDVDGAKFESVTGVSIDEKGIVRALFDNGLSLAVYQLPIAIFNNPDGLQRLQGNSFGASDLSGNVNFKVAGESGAGGIATNALEQSTVDLASEFAELIKVQRAFSASTRIITTSDQILEELTRI